jgi:hypothetical protein
MRLHTRRCAMAHREPTAARLGTTEQRRTYRIIRLHPLITHLDAPTPTCSINSKDCGRLWYSQDWKDPNPGCPSTCDGVLYTTDYAGDPLPPCYIVAESLKLAYWPVTVEGSLCGNRSTITDGVPSPRTATIWETEITSPGVIVSFHSIWAIDNCIEPNTLGEVVTDYLLFQQTSQISTQCGAYHQVSIVAPL